VGGCTIPRFALFRQGGQNTQITVKVSILFESKARLPKKNGRIESKANKGKTMVEQIESSLDW